MMSVTFLDVTKKTFKMFLEKKNLLRRTRVKVQNCISRKGAISLAMIFSGKLFSGQIIILRYIGFTGTND